jgi:hypothetical protein
MKEMGEMQCFDLGLRSGFLAKDEAYIFIFLGSVL